MAALEITTMIGCPLTCSFCPQRGLKAAYGPDKDRYLTLNNFKHIINKLPTHLLIQFAGMSEPWANPQCTEMLSYALAKGFNVEIFSTLHGMTESDADEVIRLLRKHHAQIATVTLHLPDVNGNMRGWKPSREWENVFCKFRRFGEEKVITFNLMTMDGSGRVHEALKHLNINLAPWWGTPRAGSLDLNNVREQGICSEVPEHNTAVTCSRTPFYDNNILLPNGDVVLCCMDYNLKHILGNLMTQDYYDLFAGETLSRLRQENMRPGFSKCSICKSCTDALPYHLLRACWIRETRGWDEIYR